MQRACLSVPESPVMFNACPGVAERPARPRCRLDLVLTPAGPDVFQCTSNGHSGCRLRQVWTRKVLGCFLIFFARVELRIFFCFPENTPDTNCRILTRKIRQDQFWVGSLSVCETPRQQLPGQEMQNGSLGQKHWLSGRRKKRAQLLFSSGLFSICSFSNVLLGYCFFSSPRIIIETLAHKWLVFLPWTSLLLGGKWHSAGVCVWVCVS